MPKKKREPWDRLRREPPAAYARFLVYRNLGPARSLDAAYRLVAKGAEGLHAPGSWARESARWKWCHRANEWDIANLLQTGAEAAVAMVAAIAEAARRSAGALSQADIRPRTWMEAVKTLTVIAPYIDSRVLTDPQHRARHSGRDG